MISLELVKVAYVHGNEKKETILAISSSHTALREYLDEKYGKDLSEPPHWRDTRYVIRESKITLVHATF